MAGPRKAPGLRAYEFRGRWWVWCRYCVALHCHGAGPGHRAAHCREASSPYRRSGYVLRFAGVAKSLSEIRPGRAPCDGFYPKARAAAPELRYRLLKSWMPRGRRLKNRGGSDEFIWEFDVDGCGAGILFVRLADATWYIASRQCPARGRGLDTLAKRLFGAPPAVARRALGTVIVGGDADAGR